MRYICECGNEDKIRFSKFKIGQRCRVCKYHKIGNSQRLNTDEVGKLFKARGCVLLDKYINNWTKIRYICHCGHEAEVTLNNFYKISGCRYCKDQKGAKNPSWKPDREQLKLNQRISQRCSLLVRRVLKSTGQLKNAKSEILLGYSRKELNNRITSHPYWESVKNGDWAIDHIFPVKAFLDHGIQDLKIINSLDNLRPLSALGNSFKSHKYCEEDFLLWLKIREGGFNRKSTLST
jgi:hypothetical protein